MSIDNPDASTTPNPFTHTVSVAKVPPGGKAINLSLSQDEQAEIATFLKLESLSNTVLSAELRPIEKGLLTLKGELKTTYGYISSISLVPFKTKKTIEIDLIFAPEKKHVRQKKKEGEGAEIVLTLDDEIVEPIVNYEIDLGKVIVEHLALEQDFNPKKEDENWDDVSLELGLKNDKENPFAALKGLTTDTKVN